VVWVQAESPAEDTAWDEDAAVLLWDAAVGADGPRFTQDTATPFSRDMDITAIDSWTGIKVRIKEVNDAGI